MLRAILNKSWRQHPTMHQLYGHLPPITKTIQARRTRHAGHCWRSKDELIRDVLLWTPTYGQAKAGRPARTYIQQLYEDTGCSPEDLPEAMNDREKWRERVGDMMMMMMNIKTCSSCSEDWFSTVFSFTTFGPVIRSQRCCNLIPSWMICMAWFGLVWFYGTSITVGYLILFTNPSARAGYDTRSIFKRSLTGFNWEFSFS